MYQHITFRKEYGQYHVECRLFPTMELLDRLRWSEEVDTIEDCFFLEPDSSALFQARDGVLYRWVQKTTGNPFAPVHQERTVENLSYASKSDKPDNLDKPEKCVCYTFERYYALQSPSQDMTYTTAYTTVCLDIITDPVPTRVLKVVSTLQWNGRPVTEQSPTSEWVKSIEMAYENIFQALGETYVRFQNQVWREGVFIPARSKVFSMFALSDLEMPFREKGFLVCAEGEEALKCKSPEEYRLSLFERKIRPDMYSKGQSNFEEVWEELSGTR